MTDLNSLSVFGCSLSPNATFLEREAYRRDVLQLPGPVDRWLTFNSRCANINFLRDYMMFSNSDLKAAYVTCFVKCVRIKMPDNAAGFPQPDNYWLFITARQPPASLAPLFHRKSPRVVLEHFVGSNKALNAPEWTRWSRPTLEFQQPKATFAALFVRMATWDANIATPGLPFQMIEWARSILIERGPATGIFRPATPRTALLVQNSGIRKNRKNRTIYNADDEQNTPSKLSNSNRLRRASVT